MKTTKELFIEKYDEGPENFEACFHGEDLIAFADYVLNQKVAPMENMVFENYYAASNVIKFFKKYLLNQE